MHPLSIVAVLFVNIYLMLVYTHFACILFLMFLLTGNYEDPDRSDIRVEMTNQSKVYYNNVE